MIPFFPEPYDDELLYSIVSRFHIRSGNNSHGATNKLFFNNDAVQYAIDLPTYLQDLVNNLPMGVNYSLEDFIYKHTLYPLYTPFLSSERAQKLFQSMAQGGDKGYTGILGSKKKSIDNLRYCPECIKEDLQNNNELYWHRIHQIDDCLLCFKHKVFILKSSIIRKPQKRGRYQHPDLENCALSSSQEISTYNSYIIEMLAHISQEYVWLLNNRVEFNSLTILRNNYQVLLSEKGYSSINGMIQLKKLTSDIIDFYGKEVLSILNVDTQIEKGSSWSFRDTSWVSFALKKSDMFCRPLYHILLAGFFSYQIGDLLTKKLEYIPFGKGPWPCLNPVANHYLEPVINKIDIRYPFDNYSPIGEFKCNCGFVYDRKGPNYQEKDKFVYNSIVKYGEVWTDKLKRLMGIQGLSTQDIAIAFKVSNLVIERQIKILKENPKQTIDQNSCQIEFKREVYRTRWLYLQKQYPDLTMSELNKKDSNTYKWLYRNDKDWFKINSPVTQNINVVNRSVDWCERDSEYYKKVVFVVSEMLSYTGKPIQISFNAICINTGLHAKLSKCQPELIPNTISYIKSVVETREEYHLRVLNWIKKEYGMNSISARKIYSHIRKNTCSERVKEEIEKTLKYKVECLH